MSITAGAAVALAGCGGSGGSHARVGDRAADRDANALNELLGLERRAIAAYTASIPLLSGYDRRAATVFLRQELDHAGELLGQIKRVGGVASSRAATYPLGRPRSRRQLLALLHELERAEVAAYVNAIPRLTPGVLRQTAAAILADDAQHVAVLRGALGLVPTPAPFVTGAE
jgi:bacterioferritin (cytochrome b1)